MLLFLSEILIPACESSSLAFCMMSSAYKLNKQGDSIKPWWTPFQNWNQVCCSMSSSNCCFLTHLFQNFPQFVVVHTVKGFGIVNKAEVDVFWNSLAFSMIQQMLAIWSLVPLPFLNVLADVKILIFPYISPSSEFLGDQVHCQWAVTLWKQSFSPSIRSLQWD